MTREMIRFLAQEYELASSEEIAIALYITRPEVVTAAREIRDFARHDFSEYRKRGAEPDQAMIRIMRRRIQERFARAA